MTTRKTIALIRWTFVCKAMSLLFNMLSRLVITFLPRSKHLLIHGCSHQCVLYFCSLFKKKFLIKSKILLSLTGFSSVQFSSVIQSCPTLCDSHGLQHARPPCPSPTPGVYSNLCPLSQWCHPAISSSVVPFFSHLQSFPASGSFLMSHRYMWSKYWSFSFSISPSNEY